MGLESLLATPPAPACPAKTMVLPSSHVLPTIQSGGNRGHEDKLAHLEAIPGEVILLSPARGRSHVHVATPATGHAPCNRAGGSVARGGGML